MNRSCPWAALGGDVTTSTCDVTRRSGVRCDAASIVSWSRLAGGRIPFWNIIKMLRIVLVEIRGKTKYKILSIVRCRPYKLIDSFLVALFY